MYDVIKTKEIFDMQDFFYIYNPQQALYFIQNGAYLVDINKGSKGDVYYKFPKDDKHEELFMNWKIRKYGDKAI